MKVFVSSTEAGNQEAREAVADAVEELGETPYLAERERQRSASPASSREECLGHVATSDAVVVLLSECYGTPVDGQISATHQEIRHASDKNIPLLVFVKEPCQREPAQERLRQEMKHWDTGVSYTTFTTEGELKQKVTSSLYGLHRKTREGTAGGRIAAAVLVDMARQTIEARLDAVHIGSGTLKVVCCVSSEGIIPLARLQGEDMEGLLFQEVFRSPPLFPRGTKTDIRRQSLSVAFLLQDGYLCLDECGTFVFMVKLGRQMKQQGLPTIVAEYLQQDISRCLSLAGKVYEAVLPSGSDAPYVAVSTSLSQVSAYAWKTLSEYQIKPTSGQMLGYQMPDGFAACPASNPIRRSALNDPDDVAEELRIRLWPTNQPRPQFGF